MKSVIDWFKSLPLYTANDSFRAIHAYWNSGLIEDLSSYLTSGRMSDDFIVRAFTEGTHEYFLVENLLKGPERDLPDGKSYMDANGIERTSERVKWWNEPVGGEFSYPLDAPPLFFGHYWMTGEPRVQQDNAVCLDYSICKGGKIAAYRWNGEKVLSASNIVTSS